MYNNVTWENATHGTATLSPCTAAPVYPLPVRMVADCMHARNGCKQRHVQSALMTDATHMRVYDELLEQPYSHGGSLHSMKVRNERGLLSCVPFAICQLDRPLAVLNHTTVSYLGTLDALRVSGSRHRIGFTICGDHAPHGRVRRQGCIDQGGI